MIKSYGKIDEIDQASLEARRKTRKRLYIIGISTVVLVVVVVVAVATTNHKSSSNDDASSSSHGQNSFSASVKAVCDNTLYPSSCMASLATFANDSKMLADPVKFFHIAVQVAMNELGVAAKKFNQHGLNGANVDKMSLEALADCDELLQLAMDQLKDCTSSPADLSSDEYIGDLKSWLSAAITYQHTCIDGFENATSALKKGVMGYLKNSTEFTSNSLAILTQLADIFGSINLRRRLMSFDGDQYPSWLSLKDRRLLASYSNPRKNADLVVAKDGSGKYKTINAALKKVPEKSKKRIIIYVKKGVYVENVKIEKSMWNVMFVGDGMDNTIVSGSLNFIDGTPTFRTATFAVVGKGFIAMNMGFRNTAGAAKHQAVALISDSDKSVFYRCRFDAFQDTLYTHSMRQFYRECNIIGTVDFIFGNAAVVFQNCNILPRPPMRGQPDTLTAQGKIDPNQNTGISIQSCTIWPYGDLSGVKVYLGRPWKPYSTTVYMRSMMAGIINPTGWMPWNGTTAPDTIFYSEYQNFGPGAATNKRVKWKGLVNMNQKQANKFSVGSFLGGTSWIKDAGVPFKSNL